MATPLYPDDHRRMAGLERESGSAENRASRPAFLLATAGYESAVDADFLRLGGSRLWIAVDRTAMAGDRGDTRPILAYTAYSGHIDGAVYHVGQLCLCA